MSTTNLSYHQTHRGKENIPEASISFFLIRYFPHLHFQCDPNAIPMHTPPTPLPTHSPVLALAFPCTGAYKVCKSNGPLFPVMAY
ncbi:mCG146876 [Mus musculus]|nr:mCG146876 [Mus musculus]